MRSSSKTCGARSFRRNRRAETPTGPRRTPPMKNTDHEKAGVVTAPAASGFPVAMAAVLSVRRTMLGLWRVPCGPRPLPGHSGVERWKLFGHGGKGIAVERYWLEPPLAGGGFFFMARPKGQGHRLWGSGAFGARRAMGSSAVRSGGFLCVPVLGRFGQAWAPSHHIR